MKLRVILIAGGLAIVLTAVLVFFPKRPQPAPLPSPNGYEDLSSVLPTIVPNTGDWRTQEVTELRLVLAPNSNALATIRDALKKEWAVPLAYDANFEASLAANLSPAKELAGLFCAQGRLAELEHRTNDALHAFSDCIQLAHQSTRGGLIIHDLVGMACQAIGTRAARTSWPNADDSSLREFLNRLTEIEKSSQSAEEFATRDRNWSRARHGVKYVWMALVQRRALRDITEKFRARHARSDAEMRLLRADVAIELFRRKNLRYPHTFSELVPQYLNAVPLDPFSGKAMLYRPSTNSYLLYSVGPDTKDDGGQPISRTKTISIANRVVEAGDILSTPP